MKILDTLLIVLYHLDLKRRNSQCLIHQRNKRKLGLLMRKIENLESLMREYSRKIELDLDRS